MMLSMHIALIQDRATTTGNTLESWRLLNMPEPWVVVLVILPLVALVAHWTYRRESTPAGTRYVLAGLRAASLLLLLLILARPVKVSQQQSVERAEVAVLVDDSASMRRRDAYVGDYLAAEAVARLSAAPAQDTPRLDLALAVLEQELLPVLGERGYEVRLFSFAEKAKRIASAAAIAGRGHGTHVGDALEQALTSQRGRHLTDVVIISDGRSNGGIASEEAATIARAGGVPVHTIVIGDTRPERNLVVELVEAPPSILEGDEVAISVRVHGKGVGRGVTQILLEELSDVDGEARTIASETIDLEDIGDRVVLIAPAGGGDLSRSERHFKVSVPPLPEERMLDDNAIDVTVQIAQAKIRVLYVDAHPRWEYRFLKDLLMRSDERIDAQIFLMSATPNFPQEASAGLPRLRRVPTERRELLENYDVVILGDVNPYAVSPDPAKGEQFVASLFEFIERGGGLCVIAGEYENPKSVIGTEFADLLPVKLDNTGGGGFDAPTETEHRPTLDNPSNPHEIVRLHPDLETNRKLWEDETGLRGYYWYYPVKGPKPGALVLLRHPLLSMTNSQERDPILVAGYYPSGRTLFLATDDSTWRWRYRYVHRYHEHFWRNAIRWLALGRLREGDRRFGLEPLRTAYGLDERVTLEARVLDEDYQPSSEVRQEAYLQGPDGPPTKLELPAVNGRNGLYRGTFQADRPGQYRAWIEVGGQRVANAKFKVVLPSRENTDPSPDPQAMATIARLTGGAAVSLVDRETLLVEFPGDEERREPISSDLEDAWDHWGTLLLALGLLSAEWILRKRYELI